MIPLRCAFFSLPPPVMEARRWLTGATIYDRMTGP